MSNNQLQNEEMYLPGNLGEVRIGGTKGTVTSVFKGANGATTVTIDPFRHQYNQLPDFLKPNATEDIDHELVQPKQLNQ